MENSKYPKTIIGPFYIEYTVNNRKEEIIDIIINAAAMVSLAVLPLILLYAMVA